MGSDWSFLAGCGECSCRIMFALGMLVHCHAVSLVIRIEIAKAFLVLR